MSFKVNYEVDDGYVGNRPHKFTIDEDAIETEATEEELRELYDELVYEDFQQRITPYGENVEEFIAWAKEVQKKDKDSDDEEYESEFGKFEEDKE